jgi:hypothetical protein
MANSFNKDVLIQAPDPQGAALFYVDNLGFEITEESTNMVSLHGSTSICSSSEARRWGRCLR